jgi:ABC-type bacteriocin/lantibiotic exporter with double-glycine peptidase domain
VKTHEHTLPGPDEFKNLFFRLLNPEHGFYKLVLIYSFAISLLTLAIPISVQSLIDTIANIGLVRAIVTISLFLFGLLLLAGLLYALRAYTMELFNRRIFIRLASEMAMTAIAARESGMDDRKRLSLFNRFFDIMTLKKNVPHILTNGFSLLLQSIIGCIVVSLYHPYFFLFSLVLVVLVWLVWKIWGWKAISSAFVLSEAKYETADALQSMSISLRDLKSTGNIEYILEEFNDVVNRHVDAQERHFAYNFRQLLSLLFINALASAILLGMGGWLVIQGQLTLGQLVAAELIMLGIFAGLPPLASYLDYFYDICAAVEEISRFQTLPQERFAEKGTLALPDDRPVLHINRAAFGQHISDQPMVLNLTLEPGEIVRGNSDNPRVANLVKLALTGNIFPGRGQIYLGELATNEINAFELRKMIKVIDRASVIPGTIRHYLRFASPRARQMERQESLELAGIHDIVEKLPDGIDTYVSSDGWPLTLEQTLRLKLAAVHLSRPKVLVLDQVADLVDRDIMTRVLAGLSANNCAVLYFTHSDDSGFFTREMRLDTSPESDSDDHEQETQSSENR